MLERIKKWFAIKRIMGRGIKEIRNGQIMIDFYTWQKDNLAEDSSNKEEIAKLDMKISQMETIITNNNRINDAFKAFLKS